MSQKSFIFPTFLAFSLFLNYQYGNAQSETPNNSVSETKDLVKETENDGIDELDRTYSNPCKKVGGCDTNGVLCTPGSNVSDGACFCGSYYFVNPGKGIICKKQNEQNHQLICTKSSCLCYGQKITKGQICEIKSCSENEMLTETGCVCDDRALQKGYNCELGRAGLSLQVCTQENGCKCGKHTCAINSVCYNNKCTDRVTLKPIPKGYIDRKGLPYCEDENGCPCGESTCESGTFCLNQVCYHDPYFRRINNKVYYYRFFEKNDLLKTDEQYEQYRSALWSLLFTNGSVPLCDLEIAKNSRYCDETPDLTVERFLETCGGTTVPKNVAQLYCTLSLDVYKDGLGLVTSGWQEDSNETKDDTSSN